MKTNKFTRFIFNAMLLWILPCFLFHACRLFYSHWHRFAFFNAYFVERKQWTTMKGKKTLIQSEVSNVYNSIIKFTQRFGHSVYLDIFEFHILLPLSHMGPGTCDCLCVWSVNSVIHADRRNVSFAIVWIHSHNENVSIYDFFRKFVLTRKKVLNAGPKYK